MKWAGNVTRMSQLGHWLLSSLQRHQPTSGCVKFLSSPMLVDAWSQAVLSSSHSMVKSALGQRRERRAEVAAAAPRLSASPFSITPT